MYPKICCLIGFQNLYLACMTKSLLLQQMLPRVSLCFRREERFFSTVLAFHHLFSRLSCAYYLIYRVPPLGSSVVYLKDSNGGKLRTQSMHLKILLDIFLFNNWRIIFQGLHSQALRQLLLLTKWSSPLVLHTTPGPLVVLSWFTSGAHPWFFCVCVCR